MLDNPTRENFVDPLNYVNEIETESPDEVKTALVRAIEPFTDIELDEDNVSEVLFDLFQTSLEFIVNPELESDREIQQATKISNNAKGRHGTRLLEECKHTCSRNGCGQHLHTHSANNVNAPLYEIARIDGDSRDYANLIALCPACFQTYVLGHKKPEANALKKYQDIQARSADARQLLSTVDIERGIVKVIEKLGNAIYTDFEPLDFHPVAVKDKIDEHADFFIYDEVVTHVTRFYRFIDRQMQEEVRLKTFDDTLLRAQIKALPRKLTDKGHPKMHVHSNSLIGSARSRNKTNATAPTSCPTSPNHARYSMLLPNKLFCYQATALPLLPEILRLLDTPMPPKQIALHLVPDWTDPIKLIDALDCLYALNRIELSDEGVLYRC